MDNLLTKLKDWIKVIQAALLVTIIIEGFFVVIIGVASNKIEELNWVGILIVSSIIYIFLLVVKAAYQFKFPVSIIDELISKRKLEETNKLFDRQKAINEYINSAIQGLNEQTCAIDWPTEMDILCEKALQERLIELLQPLVSYTDVILDTSTEKKFTIGIQLDYFYNLPNDYAEISVEKPDDFLPQNWEKVEDKGLMILKDELGISGLLPKDLMKKTQIGPAYEVQTAINRTWNNVAFTSHDFNSNNKQYTIICSEIYKPCSKVEISGVFFIIRNGGAGIPADVPEVLQIFNQVITNYVSKYNTCILQRILYKKVD